MKRILNAIVAATVFALAACGGQAHAAPLEAYNSANGVYTFGYDEMLAIDKDTSSGNRVAVTYATGVQYIVDDASWTVYNKIVASPTFANKFVRVGATAKYINIAKAVSVACVSSQSLVSYPVANNTPTQTISDGCQFWQAVKAVAN